MQSSLPCTRRRGSGQRFAVQVGGLCTITLHTHPFYPVRYDFTMGPKGQLDRLPVAHTGPILTFDWCAPDGGVPGSGGWIASGSLDRTVKVWDITGPHFERTPTYTIATQFPVRRVRWRQGYECELAVASNAEFGIGSISDVNDSDTLADADLEKPEVAQAPTKRRTDIGNGVEIWDVRRGYIAKWQVGGSAIEGGVSGRSPLYTYTEPRAESRSLYKQISSSETHTLCGHSTHLGHSLNSISGIHIVPWTPYPVSRLRGLFRTRLRL
jgi:WD40 repeat protein